MKVRFFHKEQMVEVESETFLTRFHKAPMEYLCKTGRRATHLVLGETERVQFQGYVLAMRAMGLTNTVTDALGTTPTPTFCGLILLRSAEDSLVMAVEIEKK